VNLFNTQAAYAFCRDVAKREAKNFYYAFRVLPQHKSDAMCAVYAFMRKADDLADDESMSIEDRRKAMAGWTEAWRASRVQSTNDPVFIALNDTQQRFGITDELLEKLVAGTTMDLAPSLQGVQQIHICDGANVERTYFIYETQETLEDYCYLVASVVGLVCIRIFGYTDPQAEPLAVDTGKAFQITNVLRDIKEDAERGRIYLPATLLDQHGVTPQRLVELTNGAQPNQAEIAMLRALTARAEHLYRSADKLIPMLEPDSRPAMRVLAEIYHRVLRRTTQPDGITLHQRVSVPTSEKLTILAGGMLGSLKARVFG
jgi:15-cis-phytoene synthase